jgi:hypothetical protein
VRAFPTRSALSPSQRVDSTGGFAAVNACGERIAQINEDYRIIITGDWGYPFKGG